MRPLADVIAAEFNEPAYRADLASIVGQRSDDQLAAWIDERCRERFGHAAVGARFAGKSVGAVFGVTLADGRGVVLKLFPPVFEDRALEAFERCLAGVVAAGFPAPPQLGPMVRADGMRGAFYPLVEGVVLDAHRPEVRRVLAGSLARLAQIAETLDPTGLPVSAMREDGLWQPPHRLGIDYERRGGEWIDACAALAKRTIAEVSLPVIAAHMDWSTKNALFVDGQLRALLDWDSLWLASEAEMVGRAAAEFTAQWEFAARLTPTIEEASAFVCEYEQARGRSFDDRERRVVLASADYLMAQIARQELGGPHDEFTSLLRETATTPLVAWPPVSRT